MVNDNDIIQLFNNNGNPDTRMLKKFNYLDNEIQVYVKNRWNDIPENYYTNKESIYRIINNIQIRPVCKYCDRPVKYMGKQYLDKMGKTVNGYRQYCSFECSCKDINRLKKYSKHVYRNMEFLIVLNVKKFRRKYSKHVLRNMELKMHFKIKMSEKKRSKHV